MSDRSMGLPLQRRVQRGLARVFEGFRPARARWQRSETGAAARGVSQEPHSADIDAAVEPTNRTRHFAPRWRGGLTSTEAFSQGSGAAAHGNRGKASRDEVICWFLAAVALAA